MLFARKDLNEVLAQAEQIVEKQRNEYRASQEQAAKNLRAAGMTAEAERVEQALKASGHTQGEKDAGKEEEAVHIDIKPEIAYDDFDRLQFAVGEVLSCEAVKKSKKLLCMQVKIGDTTRQILSGIQKHYTPEEMVGKKVCVLVNLKPAKLAGLDSEGMLLSAEGPDGTLSLLTTDRDMPSGSGIA